MDAAFRWASNSTGCLYGQGPASVVTTGTSRRRPHRHASPPPFRRGFVLSHDAGLLPGAQQAQRSPSWDDHVPCGAGGRPSLGILGRCRRGPVLTDPRRLASATAVPAMPQALMERKSPRVGLWDQYGGSMEAGWSPILEQFDFPFDCVCAGWMPAISTRNTTS